MSHVQAIRKAALALLVPLLFLNGGSARALYRCVFDNVARVECCCPPSARPRSVEVEGPTLSRASCCELEQPRAGVHAQARPERSDISQLRAPVAALSAPRLDLASRLAVQTSQRLNAGLDPPLGPPLILLKRSLLI
jgi:hypothetical protein